MRPFVTWSDPDDIGQSEYRAIHEVCDDVYQEQQSDEAVRLTLVEIKEWAESLLNEV